MPKRVGYLYEKMADKDLIRRAVLKASQHKRRRRDVRKALSNLDKTVDGIYKIIVNRSFTPKVPRQRTIYEPCSQKTRTISMVPFYPDGIMHQLMVMAMEPVLMRGMYHWSCASIPGRGTKRAKQKAERIIKGDHKGTKYGAELDIKSYYPSIPVAGIMKALERKIKDREFLTLVAVALLCYEGGMQAAMKHPFGLTGVVGNTVGIQIGFYICQWLANYYLETLDWYTISLKGVKYMIRHMDNINVFGPNKKELHKARKAIADFMTEKLGVTMKGNWQIFPISKRPFKIVGYRIARDYTVMRQRNFLRLTRQCRRAKKKLAAGKPLPYKLAAGLLSRIGQLKHCDGQMAYNKYIAPIGVERLKEVVRNESKRQHRSGECLYAVPSA